MPMMGAFCRGCNKRLTVYVGVIADLSASYGAYERLDVCVLGEDEVDVVVAHPGRKNGPRYFCKVCGNLLLPAALED